MRDDLNQAARLIKARQYARAKTALEKYLAQNPDDARAWYLLSFTEKTPVRKRDALAEAYRLAPDNAQIAARLKKIETAVPFSKAAARKRSQMPLLVGLVVLVLVTVGVVGVIVLNGERVADTPPPTLRSLATVEPTTNAVTPQEIAAEIRAETAEVTSAPATQATETAVIKTESVTTEAVSTSVLTSAPPTISTTATSTSAPAANAATAAPTLTAAPPTAAPSPTVPPVAISEAGIPINQGADVGIGNLRLVAVTRPAADTIRELGGDIPDAPANQEWVLVEVLLRCADEANCALSPAAFYLSGTSGQTYPASPQFEMPSVLGSLLANGQMWGYLGFVVSKNDSDLRLVMQSQDTRYVFAAS